jgi:hypothetical protein
LIDTDDLGADDDASGGISDGTYKRGIIRNLCTKKQRAQQQYEITS